MRSALKKKTWVLWGDLIKIRGGGGQKGFSQGVKTELRLKGKYEVAT